MATADPAEKEADAGRKIIFSYGFVRDTDMSTQGSSSKTLIISLINIK